MIEDVNTNKSKCFPLYPHPVLLIETAGFKNFLAISDVHVGLEDKIRRDGILIDTRKNIDESIKLSDQHSFENWNQGIDHRR